VQSSTTVFILFSSLTFIAGLINGVDFPLSAACYMTLDQRTEKSVGTVYGLELIGACAGAGIASVIVAPILGIVACCVFAGVANGTAFIVLLISRRSHA
jgi:spermidine synthase